ncbi:hypothetical protein POSPLADRAFT_1048888 [Postia placenta MAD-698-R-SB12]|uniref:Uncharacterized protein n=1 Tax=Postia placenta MAD-698-R-SB12 TaxID=670580 RepID=A0A1X6MTD2_9APHY|nr:hypothetical protein POSPLADRAFT_1048888 [Postia placenta MAD-698-R-SB12]OSX59579.1 hypothetical protein POSPLADRAFT_1048888 [Postia placenta MAD-698-R-SB12]
MPAPVAVCIVSAVGLLAAVYVFKEVRTLVKDRGSFVIAPMLEDLAVSYLERRRKQQASSATTSPGSTPVELNQLTPREDTRSQSTLRHRQTTGVMEESSLSFVASLTCRLSLYCTAVDDPTVVLRVGLSCLSTLAIDMP